MVVVIPVVVAIPVVVIPEVVIPEVNEAAPDPLPYYMKEASPFDPPDILDSEETVIEPDPFWDASANNSCNSASVISCKLFALNSTFSVVV